MPITLPSYVAPNELIQSAWGNGVVNALDELDDEKVDLAGDVMTGTLSIAGVSGQLRIRPTNDSPIIDFYDGDAVTRYGLIDGSSTRMRMSSDSDLVLQAGADENMRCVATAALFGKTASNLASSGVEVISSGSTSVGSIRSSIGVSGIQNLYLRHNSSASADGEDFVQFLAGASIIGSVEQVSTTSVSYSGSTDVQLKASSNTKLMVGANEIVRAISNAALFGKAASDLDVAGVEIYSGGSAATGSARMTTNTAGLQNIYCRHMTSADAGSESFVEFTRTGSGTLIGSITQVSTTGVAYNTTSDERLKTVLRDLDDDETADILRVIAPVVFAFNDDPDVEHVGFLAQQLARTWPAFVDVGVVTPGHGDPGDEEFQPWMVDLSKLVPLVVAGWQQLDRRLTALENN